MDVNGRRRRVLGACLVGSIVIVAAAFALGGWLVQDSRATGCLNDPDAPTCVVPATLPNMTTADQHAFQIGLSRVMGKWIPPAGLGPVFTQDACIDCHFTPAGGGSGNLGMSSPVSVTHFGKINPDGTFNPLTNEGGDQLQPQTIAGMQFVQPTCHLPGEVIPSDATVIVFRATPPTFGDGLIDAIPDATILANVTNQANSQQDQQLGIHGQANMGTDVDGTPRPGRFGWKAQVPTLLQFMALALVNEIGATNPIEQNKNLPQGKPIPPECFPLPDHNPFSNKTPNDPLGVETANGANFMRFFAPHSPGTLSPAAQAGENTFNQIGCAICHLPSMQTASQVFYPSEQGLNPNGTVKSFQGPSPALSNQTANLYSDLLIHDMGATLSDPFPQGHAVGSQWRTTPLWGLSLKVIYLHDGRTNDLTTAILAHGGEAALVIQNFQGLSSTDQSNLLAFLNAL